MKFITLALGALVVSACTYHAPTAPALVTVDEKAPTTLTLSATAGTGPHGGTAVVTAKVQNGHGEKLPGVTVQFTTDLGTLSSSSAETQADGTASLTLTAEKPATVIATAGAATARMIVPSNPPTPAPPAPSPTDPTPPPPPGSPSPGPGPLTVTLLVNPADAGSSTSFGIAGPGITRAVWTFGDGTSATTTVGSTNHVYQAAGVYTASVTVTDTFGRTASDGETFTVKAPPPPPGPSYSVTVSASPSSVVAGESATLTATVTQERGAPPPTSYAWDCAGDGKSVVTTGSNTQRCTYPTAGSKTSSVTVTGGSGAIGSGAVTVTVTQGAPLFVSISAPTPPVVLVNVPVTFRATVTSSGPIPAALQWEWDDNDDNTYDVIVTAASSPNDHTTSFGSVGVKSIKVRVTDLATGRTVTSSPRTVTVQ